MVRCARTNCYRGRNGQSYESEDTEGSFREVEAALSEGGAGAQKEVVGPSAGAVGVSSQVSGACFGRGGGRTSAVGKCGAACELQTEPVGAVVVVPVGAERCDLLHAVMI